MLEVLNIDHGNELPLSDSIDRELTKITGVNHSIYVSSRRLTFIPSVNITFVNIGILFMLQAMTRSRILVERATSTMGRHGGPSDDLQIWLVYLPTLPYRKMIQCPPERVRPRDQGVPRPRETWETKRQSICQGCVQRLGPSSDV